MYVASSNTIKLLSRPLSLLGVVIIGAQVRQPSATEGCGSSSSSSSRGQFFPQARFLASCDGIREDPWAGRKWKKYETKAAREAREAEELAANDSDAADGNDRTEPTEEAAESSGINMDEDEEVDMSPAEHCGFCAYFLNSPCKLAFHRWRLCVEAKKEAGEDFTEHCLGHTQALAACVDKHKLDFGTGDDENDDDSAKIDQELDTEPVVTAEEAREDS
jgi:hypothetical protein